MTVKEFIKIISPYQDYKIMSDSGWECDATEIDGAIISHKDKIIVLKQNGVDVYYELNDYKDYVGYEKLYGEDYKEPTYEDKD